MAEPRKSFPLRISNELFNELKGWAEQEMRSVNGQIEYLLRQAVQRHGKSVSDPPDPQQPDDCNDAAK